MSKLINNINLYEFISINFKYNISYIYNLFPYI